MSRKHSSGLTYALKFNASAPRAGYDVLFHIQCLAHVFTLLNTLFKSYVCFLGRIR